MANEFRVKNGIIVSSIATESGNFTIDSAADIVLDAGGTDIIFANAGTNFGKIHDSSSSFRIKVIVADDDFVVAGNDSDGESNFDAFKLDMSAAGAATFSGGIAQAGTISAGTWNGGVIASAYLDADTAHLSGTQTFTGNKTFTGTVTVGADDTGKDVKFFGATSGSYMLWDESADDLILGGAAKLGIGTTAPEYKLDVQDGSVRILPTISSNAGTAIRIGARNNGNDITLLRVDGEGSGEGTGNTGESDSAKYGFSMKYMGSGSGEGNRYAMFMDNQAGTAVEAMSILQGGNVGIGTTSPSTNLHVVSGVSNSASMVLENTNNDANSGPVLELFRNPADNTVSSGDLIGKIAFKGHFYDGSDYDQTKEWASITSEIEHYQGDGSVSFNVLQNGSSTPYLKVNGSTQDIVFNDGSSNDFDVRIESDADANNFFSDGSAGRIGIGTNAPAAKLHVDAGAVAAPSLTFGAVAGQILQNENSEFAFGLDNDSPYSLWIQGRTNANAARDISLQPLGGKIGIGTDAPASLLHIHGDMADGKQGILITRNDSETVDTNLLGAIGFDSSDGNIPSKVTEASAGIAAYAAEGHSTGDKGGDLVLFTSPIDQNDDTDALERVRITSEGNVGIGTTSPSTALQVDGTVTATAFAGALTGNVTGNAATATTATNANQVNATNDRDLAPEDLDYANDFQVFFTSKEGLEDGSTNGSNYMDAIVLNTWSDASGHDANVLAFDKSTKAIYHYQADQAATNWGTAKQIAYTDSDITGTATTVTVSNSTANTNFPVVFHDESDGLLDDTGALRYNPSTGTLLVPNLSVAGTTTQVDTVTMQAQNAVVFEGATPDAHETTLTITDPTADRTITLPNASGTVAVSAGTGIDLSAAGAVSVDVSDFMTNGANNRVVTATGTDAMNAEANLTFDGSALQVTGTMTVGVDDTGHDVKFFGATSGVHMEWDQSADKLNVTGATYDTSITNGVIQLGSIGNISGASSSILSINSLGSVDINLDTNASDTNSIFRIKEDSDVFFHMDNDGNVGIGTTSPAFPLDVNGWISTANGIVHTGDTNNTIQFDTDIQKFNTAGTTRLTIAANGTVTVAGAFLAATKSFLIPHPTKEGKTLEHGSLEGPEHGVYIRGTLEGNSVIELPDYWLGLVDKDTITVQLTGKGRFQRLYVDKIEDNKVYVENEKMHDVNCYYFIQAERKDVDKLVVEY